MTVEGWVEELSLDQPGHLRVSSTRDGVPQALFYPESNSELVFLPEPVQFKDGDVVKYTSESGVLEGGVRVRVGLNQWRSVEGFETTDTTVAAFLRSGSAVRLVPEANGD